MTVSFALLDRNVLAHGRFYASNSICDGKGSILFTYEPGAKETATNFYSEDGGKTFAEIPDVMGIYKYFPLQDGSFLGLSRSLRPSDDGSHFLLGLRRAADLAALAAGQYTDSVASAEIPELCIGWGDNGKPFMGCFDHGLVQLPNGDIIATMYGHFHADRTPLTLFPTAAFQYRTWIGRSSPSSARSAATCSSVAFRPRMASVGSPGMMENATNARTVTKSTVTISSINRFKMVFSTGEIPPFKQE